MNKTMMLPRFKIGYILFPILLSVVVNQALQAQEVQFIATAEPRVLRAGEQFSLTYESNYNMSDIVLPDLDNFQFLGGPSFSQSTQIESSRGKTVSKTTYSYTYYYRALKEGKFTLAPASAKIKNKTWQSNALTLEIVGSNASGTASGGQNGQPAGGTPGKTGDDVYVRLIINKKEAFIGEHIVATIKLYTKVQIAGIDERFKGPDFTGFYTESVEVPPLRKFEPENVDGDIYYTGVLRKVLLIPQKTGELVIAPFDLDIAVRQQVKRRSNSFFDEFFEPSVQDIPVKLNSNRIVIRSKSLPADKPVSFTGAVGDFSISSTVDKLRVNTNDAVNYKIVVRGTGNYKIIDEPLVTFPPDVEKYDPVIKTIPESPTTGAKTFEYLLIPHYPGEFTLRPVEFTFFDVSSKTYRTLRSSAHTISVDKGKGDTLLPAISGMAKEDVKLLTSDIQYIKLKTGTRAFKGQWLVDRSGYYLLYLALALLFGLILWFRRNHIRQTSDLTRVKNRKASQYARKRLKKASRLMGAENKNAFYDELLKAIWLYLSDKLNIPMAELSRESAQAALESRGISGETMDRFFEITGECEFARYAPASEAGNAELLLEKSVKLIVRLQQELS